MVHYPAEMKELQKEIDKVVEDDRLPEFDDVSQLPRVRAVAKEVRIIGLYVTFSSITKLTQRRHFDGDQSPRVAFPISRLKTMYMKGCLFQPELTYIQTNGLFTEIHLSIQTQRHLSLIGGWKRSIQRSKNR